MLDKVMQPGVAYSRQDLNKIYPEYRKELGDFLLKGRLATDVRFLSVDSSHFVHTFILKEQTTMDKKKELQEKIKQAEVALEALKADLQKVVQEDRNLGGIWVDEDDWGLIRFLSDVGDKALLMLEKDLCLSGSRPDSIRDTSFRLSQKAHEEVFNLIRRLAKEEQRGLTE